MKSICKVTILGHVAAEPEVKQTKEGHSLAVFPVATNRFVKDDAGAKREVADFHRVVAWGGLSTVVSRFVHKGMALYIDGRLLNNAFEDADGRKHYRTEISADNLSIVRWKKSDDGGELDIEEVAV